MVVVYLIGGLAAFLIARNSYNNLSEESVNKLIEEKADTISSSYNYLVKAQTDILFKEYDTASVDLPTFYSRLVAGDKNDLDPLQAYIDTKMEEMVEEGLLDLQYLFMVIPPNPLSKNPITFASNDPELVFMDMPPEISNAIEEEKSWVILEDGIPALGLEGEQLVTFTKIKSPFESNVIISFIGTTDMSSDIAEIRQFYDDEKKDAMVEWAVDDPDLHRDHHDHYLLHPPLAHPQAHHRAHRHPLSRGRGSDGGQPGHRRSGARGRRVRGAGDRL